MPELNARDAKLMQYLNEAHTKESQLEQALAGTHRDDRARDRTASACSST